MTEPNIIAFHESFDRCMTSPHRFFDVFYDDFLRSSPEVAAKFQSTDFARQKQMLKTSLYVMMSAVVLRTADYSALASTARRHSRTGIDIPRQLYGLWLDSLVNAARICDPSFDDEIEMNWREAMLPGIDYLISFY